MRTLERRQFLPPDRSLPDRAAQIRDRALHAFLRVVWHGFADGGKGDNEQ